MDKWEYRQEVFEKDNLVKELNRFGQLGFDVVHLYEMDNPTLREIGLSGSWWVLMKRKLKS